MGYNLAVRAPPIVTPRLQLITISASFIEALLGGRPFIAEGLGGFSIPRGWPDDHDRRFLELRLKQMHDHPEEEQWLVRAIVLRRDPLKPMIGHIGFHGPPRDEVLELGYTVFEPHRRQGYATEAIRGLMGWAWKEHGIRRFVASISPSKLPSLALAEKLGFHQVSQQIDPEDGLEYVFELNYVPEG